MFKDYLLGTKWENVTLKKEKEKESKKEKLNKKKEKKLVGGGVARGGGERGEHRKLSSPVIISFL